MLNFVLKTDALFRQINTSSQRSMEDLRMKKALIFFLILILSISMIAGCAGDQNKVLNIGIVQLVEHPALDASYQGFVDALKAAGYEDGKNIKISYQNGQGDQATCQTIAQKFLNDKVDLVLAIATPAAQAAANVIKEIPILITAVTDPESSMLVASNKNPGGNVTGTSDLTPVLQQLELLKKLIPSAQKVAVLYSAGETNSVFQYNLALAAGPELGLEIIDSAITNMADIQTVVTSLVGKCDAIYIPTDNNLASAMATVTLVTEPAKLPVIVGEEGMVSNGGLATVGINYYNLGYQTGEMAVKILKGEAKPADMPIEYQNDVSVSINEAQAELFGITIPADLKESNTYKP